MLNERYLVGVYKEYNRNFTVWCTSDSQSKNTDPYLTNSTKCFACVKFLETMTWRKKLGFQ